MFDPTGNTTELMLPKSLDNCCCPCTCCRPDPVFPDPESDPWDLDPSDKRAYHLLLEDTTTDLSFDAAT